MRAVVFPLFSFLLLATFASPEAHADRAAHGKRGARPGPYCRLMDKPRAGDRNLGKRVRLKKAPRHPRRRTSLHRPGTTRGRYGARAFRFRSQPQVERHRSSLRKVHDKNLRNVDELMTRFVREARAELKAMRAAGKVTSRDTFRRLVAKRLDTALQNARVIDFGPYIPDMTRAQSFRVWTHDNGNPEEYLQLDVWAFKAGQMTTPHGHPRPGTTWIARGEAVELFYENTGGRDVRMTAATRRFRGNRSAVSEKPGVPSHIHALGAGPAQRGVSNSVHLYGNAWNKAALDDLHDPADTHGQNYRMRPAAR